MLDSNGGRPVHINHLGRGVSYGFIENTLEAPPVTLFPGRRIVPETRAVGDVISVTEEQDTGPMVLTFFLNGPGHRGLLAHETIRGLAINGSVGGGLHSMQDGYQRKVASGASRGFDRGQVAVQE